MAVRKDRRKGWVVDFHFTHADGRVERIRRRSPVQTKRGAEEYERQVRAALLDPKASKKRKEVPTLRKFACEFMEGYVAAQNKPSVAKGKEQVFRLHLLPAFGHKRLDQIGSRDVDRFMGQKLKTGLSPKTVNNMVSVLRKTLTVAVDWGLIEHVPRIRWLKAPDVEVEFLDFDEAERLLESAKAHHSDYYAMIFVALRTGLRQGELLALQWGDVDLDAGRLVVRSSRWRGHEGTPKNGRTRKLPLSPETVAVLKAHRHLRGDYVFCADDGAPLDENKCRRPLYASVHRAGIARRAPRSPNKNLGDCAPGIGWHTLRHTFASHLVMRNVPLKAVQELLGHSTIEMTMRYAHLSPDVRRDAVTRLDRPAKNTSVGGKTIPTLRSDGTISAPRLVAGAKSTES